MSSTSIFQGFSLDFKNTVLSPHAPPPCTGSSLRPSNFEEPSPTHPPSPYLPPTHTHTQTHTYTHIHTHTHTHTPCSQHLWETLFFTLWSLNKFSRICSTYFENNKLKNETRELATKK